MSMYRLPIVTGIAQFARARIGLVRIALVLLVYDQNKSSKSLLFSQNKIVHWSAKVTDLNVSRRRHYVGLVFQSYKTSYYEVLD